MLAVVVLSALTLAQVQPVETAMPMAPVVPAMQQPLEAGPCLDSPRPVPRVLQPPVARAMQIVRIDRVVSTATLMPGETIGFLYTLSDGSTWLGQRTIPYMSGAAAAAVNQVLASTHMPDQNISEFPPQMKHGVATKYQQFFRVQIPPTAMMTLRIATAPCVVWPAGRPLPDPSM
ncbi:MAG: hypothetical protein JOY69_02960 [Candidatus Eremiobacteraeota bacterium]|nr:hypothetical protein [Candidatus Eremiobacteraeota bacterium]